MADRRKRLNAEAQREFRAWLFYHQLKFVGQKEKARAMAKVPGGEAFAEQARYASDAVRAIEYLISALPNKYTDPLEPTPTEN